MPDRETVRADKRALDLSGTPTKNDVNVAFAAGSTVIAGEQFAIKLFCLIGHRSAPVSRIPRAMFYGFDQYLWNAGQHVLNTRSSG